MTNLLEMTVPCQIQSSITLTYNYRINIIIIDAAYDMTIRKVNILALRKRLFENMEIGILDTEITIEWLDYVS